MILTFLKIYPPYGENCQNIISIQNMTKRYATFKDIFEKISKNTPCPAVHPCISHLGSNPPPNSMDYTEHAGKRLDN